MEPRAPTRQVYTPEAARAGVTKEQVDEANDRTAQAAQAGLQAERAERRALRRQIAELASDAPALHVFLGYVRDQVSTVLEQAGYHQHKRGEWRKRMGRKQQSTAIIGPQPFADWAEATIAAMDCADPPPAVLAEYHKLLRLQPLQARENGDLALIVRREIRNKFCTDLRIAADHWKRDPSWRIAQATKPRRQSA